jgi:hypothetical protein
MAQKRVVLIIVVALLILGVTTVILWKRAQQTAAPAVVEKITPVTTARVQTRDLPITEVAVGQETAVGFAQLYDPGGDTTRRSTVRLPFPIHIARDIRIGQPITLTNFSDGKRATGTVRQILPALNTLTQTVEIIAEVPPGSGWRPQGSVRGEIQLGVRRGARVVPEQAVVLRQTGDAQGRASAAGGGMPGAATVLYVLAGGDVVKERAAQTGLRRDGLVEIVTGVNADEVVVVDGAALLADGAKVRVREAAPQAAGTKP